MGISFLLRRKWQRRRKKRRAAKTGINADRDLSSRKRIRGLRFHIVSLLALGVSYSTFVVLSVLLPHVDPVWLQGCVIAPGTLVNYFLNSYWTFREEGR